MHVNKNISVEIFFKLNVIFVKNQFITENSRFENGVFIYYYCPYCYYYCYLMECLLNLLTKKRKGKSISIFMHEFVSHLLHQACSLIYCLKTYCVIYFVFLEV